MAVSTVTAAMAMEQEETPKARLALPIRAGGYRKGSAFPPSWAGRVLSSQRRNHQAQGLPFRTYLGRKYY